VFPLHDENPTQSTPYFTYGLIATNILIFLYQVSLAPEELGEFYHLFAVVPRQLSASFTGVAVNQPVPEWLTLFTSQFLHGSWMHLLGNMLFLWIFGNNVEDKLGHVKFIIFYLICGMLAALTQWFFSQSSDIPSLGASGAIAGVMGAYIIRFPRAKVLTLVFLGYFITTVRIPAMVFLGIWFVTQAISSFASLNAPANMGGIAYWAHAGGFVFGAILAPLMGLFDYDE